MEDDTCEVSFKIVLVGDSFVGKSNMMSKYLKNEFHDETKSTIGVEFGAKLFNIEGHIIKAQIWDTAGTEKYKAIASAYYKGARGAFIVYDITNKDSFLSVEEWAHDVAPSANKSLIILLIGNKSDLEDQRKVSKEEGENKARSINAAFMETSAFSGENIEKAFEKMINEIYSKYKKFQIEIDDDKLLEDGKDINLDNKKEKDKKGKCCL